MPTKMTPASRAWISCLFFPTLLTLAQDVGLSSDLRSLARKNTVERIQCTDHAEILNDVLAIDLSGRLRPGSDDAHKLASLIEDSFKEESVNNCDPFQRSIVDAQFKSFVSPSTNLVLYDIKILSYGTPEPFPTALEPTPAGFLETSKHTTGKQCKISDILDNYDYDDAGGCPRFGCYCPRDKIPADVATRGSTEREFASSLEETIDECREPQPRTGGKKSSKKEAPARKCLPKVKGVNSLMELREVEPCNEQFQYETTLVVTLTQDPCELGEHFLEGFLEELFPVYDEAQFEVCDSSFRRITDFSFIDICDHDARERKLRQLQSEPNPNVGFPFPVTVFYHSGDATRLTAVPQRRSLEEGSQTLTDTFTAVDLHSRNPKRTEQHRQLIASWPKDESFCLCSAFSTGTSDGISEQQFEDLAKEIMVEFSNGGVKVTDLFEATRGCNEPRKDDASQIRVELNVEVSTLTPQDLAKLEQDCVLGYNNFITDSCTPDHFQFQGCSFEPFAEAQQGNRRLQTFGFGGSSTSLFGSVFGSVGQSNEVGPWAQSFRRRTMDSGEDAKLNYKKPTDLPRFLQGNQVNTLPDDLCLCRLDADQGVNPTVDQFATILNSTGIITGVEELEEVQCRGPTTFTQFIRVIANGNLQSDEASDKLGLVIQETLNSLSIEKCVSSHFYVYNVDLYWKERKQGHVWALLFRASYAAYDVLPYQRVPLYKYRPYYGSSQGRSLQIGSNEAEEATDSTKTTYIETYATTNATATQENTNEITSPDVQDVEVSSQRELWWILQQSTCYCKPNVPETPVLRLKQVNKALDDRISVGASPGVAYALIVR